MSKYRVLVDGLTYPTDPAVIARIQAGENPGWGQRGRQKECKVGEVVDDVPEVSVRGLIRAKWIEPIDDPPEPHARRQASAREGVV